MQTILKRLLVTFVLMIASATNVYALVEPTNDTLLQEDNDTPSDGGTANLTPDSDNANLTPQGNGTLTDDVETLPEDNSTEFITVQTRDGHYFYIIIDRNGDTENVHFLNPVDTTDLNVLLADGAETSNGVVTPSSPSTSLTTVPTNTADDADDESVNDNKDNDTSTTDGTETSTDTSTENSTKHPTEDPTEPTTEGTATQPSDLDSDGAVDGEIDGDITTTKPDDLTDGETTVPTATNTETTITIATNTPQPTTQPSNNTPLLLVVVVAACGVLGFLYVRAQRKKRLLTDADMEDVDGLEDADDLEDADSLEDAADLYSDYAEQLDSDNTVGLSNIDDEHAVDFVDTADDDAGDFSDMNDLNDMNGMNNMNDIDNDDTFFIPGDDPNIGNIVDDEE